MSQANIHNIKLMHMISIC